MNEYLRPANPQMLRRYFDEYLEWGLELRLYFEDMIKEGRVVKNDPRYEALCRFCDEVRPQKD